jgi:peroxiredoxin
MLQAEIAGRLFPSQEKYPAKGQVIRDFQLFSGEGQPVLLSEIRGHSNMVLVFAGKSGAAGNLLSELSLHRAELAANEARPLAIVAATREQAVELRAELHLNFEVLADESGELHRSVGAEGQAEGICPAVFVTDRFGEVFAVYRAANGTVLPGMTEILSWLEFINRQCPECGPVEWPD